MRSSDSPANEAAELELEPQGPVDWSLEPRSDRLLLAGLLKRLAERARDDDERP